MSTPTPGRNNRAPQVYRPAPATPSRRRSHRQSGGVGMWLTGGAVLAAGGYLGLKMLNH